MTLLDCKKEYHIFSERNEGNVNDDTLSKGAMSLGNGNLENLWKED